MDTREGYQDIQKLIAGIAKVLHMSEDQVARDVENGVIQLRMDEDGNGNRFIEVCREGHVGRVFQGAVHHTGEYETSSTPDSPPHLT